MYLALGEETLSAAVRKIRVQPAQMASLVAITPGPIKYQVCRSRHSEVGAFR